MISEQVFRQYEQYIDSKNNGHTLDYIHDIYTNAKDNEGYKIALVKELQLALLKFFGQKRNQPRSDAEVLQFVKAEIINKASNLVFTYQKVAMKNRIDEALQSSDGRLADCFRTLYCSDNDQWVFEQISQYDKCRRFDLLAYLMFSKNPEKYLPLATTHFDSVFKTLGIACPTLSGYVTWDRYMKYLECVRDVRDQLIDRYPFSGISLLDAHSFLWILEDYKIYDLELKEDKIVPKKGFTAAEGNLKGRPLQGEYRTKMMQLWNSRCAVTGCADHRLLVASHAKPYSECFNADGSLSEDAYDPYNGFPLIRNYDELFDDGLITFDPDTGKIIISEELKIEDARAMGIDPKAKLTHLYPQNIPFLEYHYYHVFIDNKKRKKK